MKVDPNPLGRKLKDKSLPQPARNKVSAYTAQDAMGSIGKPDASKESYVAPANGAETNDYIRHANAVGAFRSAKETMRDKMVNNTSIGSMIRNPDALSTPPRFGK